MSGGLVSVSPTLCCSAKLRRGPGEIRARGHSRFRSKQRARFARGGERCDRSNKRCCRGSALSATTEPQATACCAEEGVSAAARNLDGASLASPSSKPPGPSSSVLFVDISGPGKGLGCCRRHETRGRAAPDCSWISQLLGKVNPGTTMAGHSYGLCQRTCAGERLHHP